MKDKINRPIKPNKEDLIRLYDVCNKIFKNRKCFYENEQFKKVRKDMKEL